MRFSEKGASGGHVLDLLLNFVKINNKVCFGVVSEKAPAADMLKPFLYIFYYGYMTCQLEK